MKKIAHCIHHTHWDLIWYFTAQDAMVQFSYNMKELIKGFKDGRIEHFFFDGQVQPIEEYLENHPEDKSYISKLIASKKLEIGPFHSQLDCFISSGESLINNLRLGMQVADKLGGSSKIAYLPDSFGHSIDFPKIFNQFGIKEFVITRGVGDEYDLGSEFIMESQDGSQLLTYVMIAGYGYGCYPFKNGTLLDNSAEDYNKISVHSLINRLLSYSTLKDEFVFPLGFDQNPVMLDIPKRIQEYNDKSDDFEFKQTTWKNFFNHVRERGEGIKVHKNELFSTQYHRVHRSIFSARADIKALQDKCERLLTYEVQPIMSMLDSVHIPYDHGLIDRAWKTLITCQTHSSANLTDATNDYIENQTNIALAIAEATKTYLLKVVALSIKFKEENNYPLIIANTSFYKNSDVIKAKIFSKSKNFSIWDNGQRVNYTIKSSVLKNHGVLRKNPALEDSEKCYYESDIEFELIDFTGIQYRTLIIQNEIYAYGESTSKQSRWIENEYYKVFMNEKGLCIYDKIKNEFHEQAIYLEDMGDEGDSFDYSYPNKDMCLTDSLKHANFDYHGSTYSQSMNIDGIMNIPENLVCRENNECNSQMSYHIQITLEKNNKLIKVDGYVDNKAEQHRVRLVVMGGVDNTHSYAGTQFGYIKRETDPKELKIWREENWFEEPSPTWPLLNFVAAVSDHLCIEVYTRSSKEYEFIGEGKKNIALTLFRAYGSLGNPDLNRRPGRPSGLDYRVFYTKDTQMKKQNYFDFAISYENSFDANKMHQRYISYATNSMYYQKQNFDKSVDLISYFPTNPLEIIIPQNYSFINIQGFKGAISTVVKADKSDAYLMRLYNSEDIHIEKGSLISDQAFTLSEVTLEEKKLTKLEEFPCMKPNQYMNILFEKKH